MLLDSVLGAIEWAINIFAQTLWSIESVSHNGDHAFNILDRALNSDINNRASYGEDAVIIDSWGGTAFPTSGKQCINDYYNIDNRSYNFLAYTNSHYHRIKTACSFNTLEYRKITISDPDKR